MTAIDVLRGTLDHSWVAHSDQQQERDDDEREKARIALADLDALVQAGEYLVRTDSLAAAKAFADALARVLGEAR